MASRYNVSYNNLGPGARILVGNISTPNRRGNTLQHSAEESHDGIRELRTEGTCEWLLANPEFMAFENSEVDSILWIHGARGCGKSTLISSLIDRIRKKPSAKNSYLLFFYVDFKQKQNQPYNTMIKTFIQQAQDNEEGSRSQKRNDETDQSKLFRVLDKDKNHVYIVIDAVDQLSQRDRFKLLDNLNALFQKRKDSKRQHRLAVIISSHNRDGCKELITNSLFEIQVKPDDNRSDIQKFLEEELRSNLFTDDSEFKDLVVNDIANKSNGIFLWAKLQAENVSKMVWKADVRAELQKNFKPKEIEQVYKMYAAEFEALSGKGKKIALRTMAFLAHTAGSMSKNLLLEALNFDTCIEEEEQVSAAIVDPNDNLYKIVQTCKYLIEIDEKQGVFRFCHSSVSEFFQEHKSMQAHNLITRVCIEYISSVDFPQGYDRDAKWYNYGNLEPILQKHPFLKFASCNWADSYKKSSFKYTGNEESDKEVVSLLRKLLGDSVERGNESNLQLSFQVYMLSLRDEIPGGIRYEHIISRLGLVDILDYLKRQKMIDLQKVDEEGLSAIHWAIRKAAKQETAGDSTNREIFKVVEKLISYGGKIDAADKEGRTPLHYAARYGLSEVVRLLKDKKADLNIRDNKSQTALIAACREHHEEVITMLVEAGADFQAQSSCGTALQILCLVGCCNCVELILCQYEAKDRLRKLYPLVASSSVAKHLLSRYYMGHFGEGKGTFGTSLHAAAFHGREDVVKLLLNRGKFYVGATHHTYGSALTAAAAGCNVLMEAEPYKKIFNLLIDHGVDVNDGRGTRGPALRAAALNGHKALVELLLNKGAKDGSVGGPLDTAYQAARKGGHEMVMQLLKPDDGDSLDTTTKGSSESTSFGISHVRQEFFKVAFTIADKDNIWNLIQNAETYMCNEIRSGELTTKLSMMLALSKEVFNDTVKLATSRTCKEELQTTKKHKLAEVWEECASLFRGLRRGPRHDCLHTVAEGESASYQVTTGSSPSVGELNTHPDPLELQDSNERITSKISFLRKKKKPLFNTDNFDFTGTLDLMTRTGVAVLQQAIEFNNINAKNQIAYAWVDILNNLMTSNAHGESLLKTVVNSRAVELRASLIDPHLSENERLKKAQALSRVGVELLLVTFRHRDKFQRLSLIFSNLCNSAINDVEDLGEQGHKAVRDMLRVIGSVFSEAVDSKDQFEVRVCGDAGVEVLRQAALNPKKNLINAYADEWVRQWNLAIESNMAGVIRDIIEDRWQEHQVSLKEEKYDQVLSLVITSWSLLRAAFEQELEAVIEALMPTVEEGFDQTMKSFHGNAAGLDQGPSQALEREFSEERRHIYENIVEGVFKLFSTAEIKQSNRLDFLAEMIVAGIQNMSTEARQKLDEVIISHARVARNGTNIQRKEIALTFKYFLTVAGNARMIETEQFSLWVEALIAEHIWLLGYEEHIIRKGK